MIKPVTGRGCTQMLMLPTLTTNNDDNNWHTMDRAWLHRLHYQMSQNLHVLKNISNSSIWIVSFLNTMPSLVDVCCVSIMFIFFWHGKLSDSGKSQISWIELQTSRCITSLEIVVIPLYQKDYDCYTVEHYQCLHLLSLGLVCSNVLH